MELAEQVGCIAPRAQGGLIAALENGCALSDAWGAAPRAFGPAVLADKPEQRFNDGRVDALGRLWVGSLTNDKTNPAATLYRPDPDGSLTEILHGLRQAMARRSAPTAPPSIKIGRAHV